MDKENNSDNWGSVDQAEEKARNAHQLFRQDKFSEALKEIEFSIMVCPNNSSWHFNKGLILDAMHRYEEAIREYEFVLSLLPNNLDALNRLGVNYTRTGQHRLALDAFQAIQEIDPDYEPCYCNRIIVYAEMGQKDLAEQMFYLAQQIKSDCPLCYYNMGTVLFADKDYKRAIYCLSKTAELNSSHPGINYCLAKAYWLSGEKDIAQEFFLKELRESPGNINAILDFGLLLVELNKIELAKEKFHRILELKPDFALALFHLGEIAFSQKDFDKAEDLFKQALEKDGKISGLNYRLACCSLRKKLKTEARYYLLEELKNPCLSVPMLTSIGSIFLACRDLGPATHCQLRAIDQDSDNVEAFCSLGLISMLKGNLDEAIGFLERALNLAPDNIFIMHACLLAFSIANKLNEAEKMIEKLLKLCSSTELKKFKFRIRLVQRLPQRAAAFTKRFLLPKMEQKALKTMSSVVYEINCSLGGSNLNSFSLMTQEGKWMF